MEKDTEVTNIRMQDPYLARETQEYGENPLPSREFIMQVLTEQGVPVPLPQLIALLGISPEEEDIFLRRLRAMERDGQIMRNRKNAILLVDKLDLISGRVQGHPDGFGFLVPDEGEEEGDLFLSPREMGKVLNGDRVMAREIGVDRRGRREGAIVEVLERANSRIVGRLHREHGVQFVVAEDQRISQDILVPPGEQGEAQPGQVVTVEIIEQPTRKTQPAGRVVEILGHHTDPGIEIEIALRKHQLPYEFPPAAIAEAEGYSKKVLKKDMKGHEDIRDLPLVTIDSETARDFDDAVFCEREGDGFRLVVAIADVSHYVRPQDPLDQEALARGNSVYFPRRVIPMLPEALSNGLCSLNPDVDRLCMVCDMSVDPDGEITSYRFYPGVMHSHGRLTYTQVAAALLDPQAPLAQSRPDLMPHLHNLYALFKALLEARERRGAIDFETVEAQMVFNVEGKIERIQEVHRNDAHRLIEECMLAANVCASEFLLRFKQPTLFRIHAGPTPEKLEALREFLREFGLALGGGDKPHAIDYANLLDEIKDRPDAKLLQTVMLRSLSQAVYSPENVGHFGLAYEAYAHFTSPIRRYPDLLVHRGIKAVLDGKKYVPEMKWKELGAHCSKTERRADEATRDVESWLKCFYMIDKVGESFWGTISAVTGFGIFVALDDMFVEGLVHVSELGNDYFKFEPAKHLLIGERTGQQFRLGGRVRVRVARVDMESSKIDFVLDEEAPAA